MFLFIFVSILLLPSVNLGSILISPKRKLSNTVEVHASILRKDLIFDRLTSTLEGGGGEGGG